MAWSFVGATAVDNATGNGANTNIGDVTEPGGCQDGDIGLLFVGSDSGFAVTGSPPAGWTQVGSIQNAPGGDNSGAVFWARRGGTGPASFTDTWSSIFSGNERVRSVLIVYRGAIASGDVLDGLDQGQVGPATAIDTGSITPTTNGCKIVAFFTTDPAASGYTMTWDSPATERIDSDTSPSGERGDIAYLTIADLDQSTAASVSMGGDVSTSDGFAYFIFGLKPQVSAGDTSYLFDSRRLRRYVQIRR